MKQQNINQRESNIELLRIIAICGVVILHFNNPLFGKAFSYATGINKIFLYGLESFCICAVDLFVLISGYFMCRNSRRNLIKPLELVIQVSIFGLLQYSIRLMLHRDFFSKKLLVQNMIPSNWFIILYIVLYFVSPILNFAIERAARENILKKFIFTIVIVFSVYPTFIDMVGDLSRYEYRGLSSIGMYGNQSGYSIVNFAMMYCIGATIYYFDLHRKSSVQIMLILVETVLITAWAFVNNYFGYIGDITAWEYCNPLVVFLATDIFLLFRNLKLKNNKAINSFAKCTFSVYLLHMSFFFLFDIKGAVEGSFFGMIKEIFFVLIVILTVSWVVNGIYTAITNPIIRLLKEKTFLGKDLYK